MFETFWKKKKSVFSLTNQKAKTHFLKMQTVLICQNMVIKSGMCTNLFSREETDFSQTFQLIVRKDVCSQVSGRLKKNTPSVRRLVSGQISFIPQFLTHEYGLWFSEADDETQYTWSFLKWINVNSPKMIRQCLKCCTVSDVQKKRQLLMFKAVVVVVASPGHYRSHKFPHLGFAC